MSTPHVPVSPGDHDRPEWWTPADDAILAGELAKLADLPRPAALPHRQPLVPGRPAARPAAPAWPYVLGAVLALLLLLSVVVVGFGAYADTHPRPSSTVTPTTYGPPGPAGGAFTSMPVR